MGFETVLKCDGCGSVRGKANHWWLVRKAPRENEFDTPYFTILPVEEHHREGTDGQFFCGAQCRDRALSVWTTDLLTTAALEAVTR